jgi:predicted nucleotidyltransferase
MKTLTPNIILEYIANHKFELAKYDIKKIGLFGSYARNNQSRESDIDFLVEYNKGKKTFDNYIYTLDFLEQSFNKEIELITKDAVSKNILTNIEKEIKYVQITE